MANLRKIAVVTGSRAEYGLLYWLLKDLDEDPSIELQVLVTGQHLSPKFGNTYQQIENDGFAISACVDIGIGADTELAIACAVASGVSGFAKALDSLKPDVMVVLGDRFEILAAAQAALFLRIPVGHIQGGEVTEGAVDESIRHAVTKMSHLHFTAADPYRRRVIQLGERPERVFQVGAIGLDTLGRKTLMTRSALSESLGIALDRPFGMVTLHPETLGSVPADEMAEAMLSAMTCFPEMKWIITQHNSDAGGAAIGLKVREYAVKYPKNFFEFVNLGHLRYLSALAHSRLVLGNSSSGIIEAPTLNVPTVDIGDRQRGRLMADSIVHAKPSTEAIRSAIETALSESFMNKVNHQTPPYGLGEASKQIHKILKQTDLKGLIPKSFYDL